MTDQPAIRQGHRNPRNLYSGPDAADHFAVVVGDLDHAAAVSGWLVEAARAHIAAGHPMPEPRPTTDCELHPDRAEREDTSHDR